jgi:tripartite-type tricarboxylate transporter receptor subunit TctC
MGLKRLWTLLGFATAVLAAPAQAQDYPSKAVTFISPAAAGNSVDVATRLTADRLSQLWKQQVVVLNRPGAGGLLAAQAAAAVEKDGYTLYMTQSSTWTVLPVMQEGRMPFNLQSTFAPIGFVGEQPIALAINKDIPANSVAELLELVRKAPDGMLFGATNRGGQAHLTGELLRERTRLNLSFVHAQGAAATLNDLLAGRLPMMFEGLGSLRPHMASGGVKLLATAAEKLAQGPGHARGRRAVPHARHLPARLHAGADRRVHARRGAALVAGRARGQPSAGGAAAVSHRSSGANAPGGISLGST